MTRPFFRWALLSVIVLPHPAPAQSFTPNSERYRGMDFADTTRMEFDAFLIGSRDPHTTEVQSVSGPASRLDLKSSGKARHEYEHGYQALLKKDLPEAVIHLKKSIDSYPKFVAAHNALGTAYLELGQNDDAKREFLAAVALDAHLPNSFLNLGCAQLALKQYPEAVESLHTASGLAPLDIQLQLALVYAQFKNKDYSAAIITTRQVHAKRHDGAAAVHLYAAMAWAAQGDLNAARDEMETLLKEDPLSSSADHYRQILDQIESIKARRSDAALRNAQAVAEAQDRATESQTQYARQQEREARQIDEAEATPDATCSDCDTANHAGSYAHADPDTPLNPNEKQAAHVNFRIAADEVSVFFAATDHGRSVPDLAASDLAIRDDQQPPSTILSFRNQSQLPLRLGLIIDTSDSIHSRFNFEQEAAGRFLQKVARREDDLAFVVGVNNSALLVQDFTNDQTLTARGVNQLAPRGGTALWDAVAFAAEKLSRRPESEPVARVLVVISDGEDNSSSATLKTAIAAAQRGEVAVYTVNSRDEQPESFKTVGDRALEILSEQTGGADFKPGSINRLSHSLAALEQVIRSRYLVSYRPATFRRDDAFRTIEIAAQKDGRKLKVFARKGYYASASGGNP
jgi:Ca-activated chloride channel homolog